MEAKTENEQSVGSRLLELRTRHNLTQEELAEHLAVSRQSVSKWELNKTLPDVDKLVQLSDMYEVSIDYLVKGIQNTESCEDDLDGLGQVSGNMEGIHAQKGILFFCMLLSGIICIGLLIFEVRLLSSGAFKIDNKERGLASVNRILEQYTKAEVGIIDDSGNFNKKVVWLDVPGVRENDFVDYYHNKEKHGVLFEYYFKTLILPVIAATISLIFFIVFWLEWRTGKGCSGVAG